MGQILTVSTNGDADATWPEIALEDGGVPLFYPDDGVYQLVALSKACVLGFDSLEKLLLASGDVFKSKFTAEFMAVSSMFKSLIQRVCVNVVDGFGDSPKHGSRLEAWRSLTGHFIVLGDMVSRRKSFLPGRDGFLLMLES